MNSKNNNYIDEIIKWILYMISWTDKNKKLYMCLNVIMKNARKIVPKVQLPVDYLAQEIEKNLYQF